MMEIYFLGMYVSLVTLLYMCQNDMFQIYVYDMLDILYDYLGIGGGDIPEDMKPVMVYNMNTLLIIVTGVASWAGLVMAILLYKDYRTSI